MDAGLQVKINTVLLEGVNDNGWEQMLLYAGEHSVDVRFIEIMPIGAGSTFTASPIRRCSPGFGRDTRTSQKTLPYTATGRPAITPSPGFAGGVGFISAMHGKFCDHCNRIRMSAQGEISHVCAMARPWICGRRCGGVIRMGKKTERSERIRLSGMPGG